MKNAASLFSSRAFLGFAVALFSLAYYALYINVGFNFSDAGNYAQISYELFLGRDPGELALGYGILWFKVGEILFRVFGVDYTLVSFFFYFCIVITNILVFYVVNLVTRSRSLSLSAAIASALAPAFPATSFYALCILLNTAAQMRLARGSLQPWNVAFAGAVLSFTFQIRPDFGFVFAIPLSLIVVVAALEKKGRWRDLIRSALAGFLVVTVLGFLSSLTGGYSDVFLRAFTDYPITLAEYFIEGLRGLFFEGAGHAALTREVLARPLVSDVAVGGVQAMQLVLLVYLPVLIMVAFLFLNVVSFFKLTSGKRFTPLATSGVAFFAAIAAFPHYFLYRPDMSHIANFMPGYIVMLAVFAAQIRHLSQSHASMWKRGGASVAIVLMSVNLGLYLWAGMQSPGTGSIAVAEGRTEKFVAGNGVDVLVARDEKLALEFLRDVVEGNSEPDDTIVCVPYCPGVAFMTERQMLFGNFYVDNALLVSQPTWIANALKLTRENKPAVVIVIDWAINGTEKSRFSNWAASYVREVERLSRDIVVNGAITAYIL